MSWICTSGSLQPYGRIVNHLCAAANGGRLLSGAIARERDLEHLLLVLERVELAEGTLQPRRELRRGPLELFMLILLFLPAEEGSRP